MPDFSKFELQQPKREVIAGYGGLKPTIYETWADAKKVLLAGKRIIVRSEHPDELGVIGQPLGGPSGIATSMNVYPDVIKKSEHELRDQSLFNELDQIEFPSELSSNLHFFAHRLNEDQFTSLLKKLSRNHVKEYCQVMGYDVDAYESHLTYSFWEHIPGVNMTVVADNILENRWHVYSDLYELTDDFLFHFATVDKPGADVVKLVNSFSSQLTDAHRQNILSAIDFYEDFRNVRGAPGHCPIVEMQVDSEGQFYPLQWHTGRDFSGCSFRLIKPPTNQHQAVPFVRGATATAEGEEVTLFASRTETADKHHKCVVVDEPILRDKMQDQALARAREVCVSTDLPDEMDGFHILLTNMHKPGLSVLQPKEFLKDDKMKLFDYLINQDEKYAVKVHLVADGNQAYIRHLGGEVVPT